MRYYSIEIDGGATYTSYSNGVTNPSALQVEMDIPVISFDLPTGDASVRIWGVGLDAISQSNNLINKNIKVFGGFQKGLPLANPAQAGLLAQGYIINAFGHWLDTEQWLHLIIRAGSAPTASSSGAVSNAKDIPWIWNKGDTMAAAIKTALTTAYPGYTVNTNISDKLIFSEAQNAHYSNLNSFAQYVKSTSKSIIGTSNYPGVLITLDQKTFTVIDGQASGSQAPAPGSLSSNSPSPNPVTAIAFNDIIGQPSWQNAPLINFFTAMRADLKVGRLITMPKSLVTNSAQAQSFLVNQKLAFQGQFQIQSLRHVGNYRQSDATAWTTVIDAYPLTQGANPAS